MTTPNYKIKKQKFKVTVKDGMLNIIDNQKPELEEVDNADELSDLTGDAEDDVPRISTAIHTKNQSLRAMVTQFGDGEFTLEQFILTT